MPKYSVTIQFERTQTIEVEADSKDEAIELVNEGEPPILDEEVLKKKVLSEMPKKLPIFSQKPPSLDELV